jgi:hypothetical protein
VNSILAALIASILSLFGLHQPLAHRPPSVPPTAIVAATAASIGANGTSATDPHSASTFYANPSNTSAPSPHYVTQTSLNVQLSALEQTILSELQTLASALASVAAQTNGTSSASSTIQQQLDTLQHEISQTNQINNLSNVTITSPTFSGVTTSNVPEGSNLYFTNSRVTSLLSGASATTTFGAGISTAALNVTSSSATSTFANGIALSGGCVSVSGTCLGAGGGASLSTANTWTALQQFQSNASTTGLSAYNGLWVGTTATTTILGNATSTFGAGISATYLNLTGSSATSTAANGINLTGGCFSIAGTCVGGGGGSSFQSGIGGTFTVESGNSVSAGNLVSLLADGNIVAAGSTSAGGIDFGTPVVVSNNTSVPVIADLSSSVYAMAYTDGTNSSYLTTAACSVSGTTVTCGTPVVVSNSTNAPASTGGIIDLSSSAYAITYLDSTNSSKLTTAACSVSGTTVTCGTPVVVTSSTNAPSFVTDLSSSTYVMTYKDSTNGSKLTTAACSVSGTTVTCGTPVVVSSDTTAPSATVYLSSSLYATTYLDSTNSSKLTTAACSVSGTTVTCGTPVVVSNSTNGLSNTGGVLDLSSSVYAMTYRDSTNANKLTTTACSVSGTTVTCGTPVVVSNSTNNPLAIDLSSSAYAITYTDSTNSSKLTTAACTVSGTTVTCGTPVVVSNTTNGPTVTDLSSSAYALTYKDSNNGAKITTAACTVSGTTVTCGTPVVVSYSTNGATAVTDLSSSAYVVTYQDTNNSSRPTTAACSVSGTTVTCGTAVLVSNNTNSPTITDLSSSAYVITYTDTTNGTAITTVAANFVSVTAGTPVGVAAASGSAGQSVNVVGEGVASGFSGLTVGTVYYANTDGTITSTSTPNRLGVAVSSTQIQLSSKSSSPNTSTQNFGDAVFANNFAITEAPGSPQGLIFRNQLGTQVMSIDENGNLSITGQFSAANTFASEDATTTASSTIAASFSDASHALQDAIGAIGDTAIRILGDAAQATVGVFDTIIAKVAYIDTINSRTLCLGSTCVTEAQLQALLQENNIKASNASTTNESVTTADQSNSSSTASITAPVDLSGQGGGSAPSANASTKPESAPVIQVNGDNPSTVEVGATYSDLGATITAPAADTNLGIKVSIDGGATTTPDQIVIDTSKARTHTIVYSVTDQNGLTGTTARTVNVVAPAPPSGGDVSATSTPPAHTSLTATSTRTVIISDSPSIIPTVNASTTASTTSS